MESGPFGQSRHVTDMISWLGGVLAFAWFLLFLFVTLAVWDRWGMLAGLAAAAVWILIELTVVKAAKRLGASDG